MALPASLENRLSLPLVAAPMFLVSGPELVINCCKNGVLGSFPALNQRTSEGYEAWLNTIEAALDDKDAPFAVNLIVHRSNPRLQADLEITVKHKVPVVITSLGAAQEVVDAVHSYGGLVFHDVTTIRFAEKALEAGVDGLIAVCAGAGGHAGTYNPFAFIAELRAMTDKTLLASGCISTGDAVLAAQACGADLAYAGTRFITAQESLAFDDYKTMVTQYSAADIVYTPKISGAPANFLAPSLQAAGVDLAKVVTPEFDPGEELSGDSKAWKDIWSAGQGIGSIRSVQPTAEIITQFKDEYRQAFARLNRYQQQHPLR